MNAKKILVCLLALTLAFSSLVACGKKNKPDSETEQTADAPVDTSPVEIEDEGVNFWLECNAGFDSAVFGDAADFQVVWTEDDNGEVKILSYTGTAEHLIIPTEIEGMPVTSIGDGAFAENTTLKTLIIPESVTRIGTGILAGCEALNALQTPLIGKDKDAVQYLGYLFGATTHEDNARDIPASLKCFCLMGEWQTLPAYALFDCNDLICLGLPETLTIIEKFALYNCASLRQIDSLERIVTFGDRAMMNCSSLQTVTLGSTLQTVGFGAFEGCESIRAMKLPFVGKTKTENTYLGYIFGAAQPDFAKGFYPDDLARITLTGNCQTLGNYAFFECETLKEIALPEGLTTIGVRAFYGCESLWKVELPDSVTTLRELAFANCDALTTIHFGNGLVEIGINAFFNCDSLIEIKLPNTLKTVPASCFAGCTALAKVDLGGTEKVEAQAFRHCNAMTTVTANGDVEFEEGNDNVKNILNSK